MAWIVDFIRLEERSEIEEDLRCEISFFFGSMLLRAVSGLEEGLETEGFIGSERVFMDAEPL